MNSKYVLLHLLRLSGVLGAVGCFGGGNEEYIPLYGGEGGATEDGGLDEGSLLLRLLWLAGGKAEGGEVEDKFD